MIYHNELIDSVLKELESDSQNGLSNSDIPILLAEYGDNKLKEKRKKQISSAFLINLRML